MYQCTEILSKGCYRARFASGPQDLSAARGLRSLCFGVAEWDLDPFDAACSHVLIEDIRSADLVCCFRLLEFPDGAGVAQSYSGQFYDLSALSGFPEPMIEMGRFCSHPDCSDPDILRLAWAALTRIVDDSGIQLVFGCTSFSGTEIAPHLDAFSVLMHHYQAPDCWRPEGKAPDVVRFDELEPSGSNCTRATIGMPQMLRSYLMMGGWVSDHAVIDHAMNTLHVFTGLEIGAVPATRKRLLRGAAE